ncbi:MAG: hypothetical protein AB7S26_40190 [Sandaracinaceae bacterium]
MTRASLLAAVAIVLVGWTTTATAQIAGVPVGSLTPAGMQRVDVEVPEHEGHGVRLYFAPARAGSATVRPGADDSTSLPRATLRVDVLVADDAAAAAAALAWIEQTVTREMPQIASLGDRGWGDTSIVAFVRDNVFVTVQRVGEGVDARAHALAIDAAIARAPRRGAPAAPRIQIPVPAEGVTALPLPAEILAAHVTATGSVYARRTRAGWALVRRGDGPWTVTVMTSDALLRRSRVESSGR